MEKIIYSIIIPFKNDITFLKRCVKSIPKRKDLEIIIIDDNSDNIDVINNELQIWLPDNADFIKNIIGGGAGRARNIGITLARGKWIIFADADDWFEKEFNTFLDKYKEDDLHDLVYINAHCVNDKGKIYSFKINRYIKNYLYNKPFSEKVLRYFVWTPWTRMVKKSLILEHKLEFEEIPLANDLKFGLECSYYAKSIMAENNILYAYYKPAVGSITDKNYTVENYLLRLELKIRLNKFYDKVGFPFKWPMWTALSLHRFKCKEEKERAKIVRTDFLERIGGYNWIKDLGHTIMFFAGKVFRII